MWRREWRQLWPDRVSADIVVWQCEWQCSSEPALRKDDSRSLPAEFLYALFQGCRVSLSIGPFRFCEYLKAIATSYVVLGTSWTLGQQLERIVPMPGPRIFVRQSMLLAGVRNIITLRALWHNYMYMCANIFYSFLSKLINYCFPITTFIRCFLILAIATGVGSNQNSFKLHFFNC